MVNVLRLPALLLASPVVLYIQLETMLKKIISPSNERK